MLTDCLTRSGARLASRAAILAAATLGAHAHAQGTFYACASGREFYSVNPVTGAATRLGSISAGVPISASLTHDCATGITYVASTGGNFGVQRKLYTLDLSTRQATIVGDFGDPAMLMHGIEIDPRTGILYSISSHDGGLYRIDRTTGLATLIGFTGITGVGSFGQLAFDSLHGVMYATNSLNDSLYRVNLSTGATSLVGVMTGTSTISALAFDSGSGTMYAIENSTITARLFTLDLETGAATLIGPMATANLIGLVYVTSVCPPTPCRADLTGSSDPNDGAYGAPDGSVDADDFFYYLDQFVLGNLGASDLTGSSDPNDPGYGTPDGLIDAADFFYYLDLFVQGCP
jgi:hypothetical protein